MVSRWLWPRNRTFLAVVTWWIVAFLPSVKYHNHKSHRSCHSQLGGSFRWHLSHHMDTFSSGIPFSFPVAFDVFTFIEIVMMWLWDSCSLFMFFICINFCEMFVLSILCMLYTWIFFNWSLLRLWFYFGGCAQVNIDSNTLLWIFITFTSHNPCSLDSITVNALYLAFPYIWQM